MLNRFLRPLRRCRRAWFRTTARMWSAGLVGVTETEARSYAGNSAADLSSAAAPAATELRGKDKEDHAELEVEHPRSRMSLIRALAHLPAASLDNLSIPLPEWRKPHPAPRCLRGESVTCPVSLLRLRSSRSPGWACRRSPRQAKALRTEDPETATPVHPREAGRYAEKLFYRFRARGASARVPVLGNEPR